MKYYKITNPNHFILYLFCLIILTSCNQYRNLSNEELCAEYWRLTDEKIKAGFGRNLTAKISEEIERRSTVRLDSTSKDGVKHYSYINSPTCVPCVQGKYKIIWNKECAESDKLHQIRNTIINGNVIYDFKRDNKNRLIKSIVRKISYMKNGALVGIKNDTVKIGEDFIGILGFSALVDTKYFELYVNKNNKMIKVPDQNFELIADDDILNTTNIKHHYKEKAKKIGINEFEGILKFQLEGSPKDSIKFLYKYIVIE